MTSDKIAQLIYHAIDSVNELRSKDEQIKKDPEARLLGGPEGLDSLGMVNLIVAVEQQIEERCHVVVDLADDELMALKGDPFATVGSLADYVAMALERKGL